MTGGGFPSRSATRCLCTSGATTAPGYGSPSGCRAALLNPAVHPASHFHRYLGPQRNLHTGEAFVLTDEHVEELAALDLPRITRRERYWLFVETGDEVLDYREAIAFYEGACHTIVRGGDHSLASFPEHVPDLVAWAAS